VYSLGAGEVLLLGTAHGFQAEADYLGEPVRQGLRALRPGPGDGARDHAAGAAVEILGRLIHVADVHDDPGLTRAGPVRLLRLLLADDDAGPEIGRSDRRGEAGAAAANDHQIRLGVKGRDRRG
jgi:hypothetical protein